MFRQGIAFEMDRTRAHRVIACSDIGRVGDGGVCHALLEGVPAVVIEPALLRGKHNGEPPPTDLEAPPRWAVVVGNTGDLLLAIGADRIEMFASQEQEVCPLDLGLIHGELTA